MPICVSLLGGVVVLVLGCVPPPQPEEPPAVKITVQASRTTLRAGERVDFEIMATNESPDTLWTNPSIICTGSWDLIVRDAGGEPVRIDDRDLMSCPRGGLLKQSIAPQGSTRITVDWDGRVRSRAGGEPRDVPRGTYEVEATVRWADRVKTANAPGPHTFIGSARTSIEVWSEVPPVTGGPAPPGSGQPIPPAGSVDSGESLRELLDRFEPPTTLLVETGGIEVAVALRDYREAQAALTDSDGEIALPDVVVVDGVRVPYHAAWKAETDGGRRQGLAAWAEQQAAKHGVSADALRAAVAADWTRQGREREAQRDRIRAEFLERYGAGLDQVTDVLKELREGHQATVIAELARRHGISHPRVTRWGPAGRSVGIEGTIDGEPVVLFEGEIYRGENRPPRSLKK